VGGSKVVAAHTLTIARPGRSDPQGYIDEGLLP